MNRGKIKELEKLKTEIAKKYLKDGKRKSVMVSIGKDGYFYVENQRTAYRIDSNNKIKQMEIDAISKHRI